MNTIEIIELSSPGCHNCAAFQAFWDKEKAQWPNATLKEVSILDPEGQALAQKHQVFASPGIFINGELFSTGGVNKEDFVKKIKELS